MADEQPSSSQSVSQEDGPLVVNLYIVSPSDGVGNLRFRALPATTTVRQLKEKIRAALASRPPDDHQRLIHRGRLLSRDTDTLQDVLGEEAIQASDQQTIHLVVRDTGDHSAPAQTPAQATPTLSQSPAPGNAPPRPDTHIHQHLQHALRNAATGVANPALARPGSAPIGTPHAAAHLPQHHQHQHQDLVQRINQLQQREANYRQMLAQRQNYRTAFGHPIPADGANYTQGTAADATGGRHSPFRQPSQTVTREGTGPDGQHFSLRITLNEVIAPPGTIARPPATAGPASDPVGHRPLSAADVHNIIHGADATRAAQAMANAMQRNASGAAPAHRTPDLANLNFNSPIQPIQPGVTTPIFPGVSRNASRTATPDPAAAIRSVSHGSSAMPSISQPQAQAQPPRGQPEVYILSSPSGPRGLLINSTSEMYTTPAARPQTWMPYYYYRPPPPYSLPGQEHAPQLHFHQAQGQAPVHSPGPADVHIHIPNTQVQNPQAGPGLAQQQPLPPAPINQAPAVRRRPVAAPAVPEGPAPLAAQANHPANPGAGALVVAAWPHIWLAVRLMAFAWWFSYSDPSWERWLSLALAFLIVLAINTGIFNTLVNNAFHPVREQLEGMIPFADPDRQREQQQRRQQTQQEGGGVNPNGGNGPEPDPAQTAARLVAQRRIANGNWLRAQLRRIERAGILFLASFAPGVAERHIQQLEEREREERRAAEEARAAAAARAADQQAETTPAGAENQPGEEGQRDGAHAVAAQDEVAGRRQEPDDQAEPPMVAI